MGLDLGLGLVIRVRIYRYLSCFSVISLLTSSVSAVTSSIDNAPHIFDKTVLFSIYRPFIYFSLFWDYLIKFYRLTCLFLAC